MADIPVDLEDVDVSLAREDPDDDADVAIARIAAAAMVAARSVLMVVRGKVWLLVAVGGGCRRRHRDHAAERLLGGFTVPDEFTPDAG